MLFSAGVPAIVTWSIIALALVLPCVDPTRAPYFDLTQTFSEVMYWLAQSGGKLGLPIVITSMLMLLVTRGGITSRRRWREVGIVVSVAVVWVGGGAAVNEHVLKEKLKVARPNIVWLAGDNGSGPLGMTPEGFYRVGDKEARRVVLARVLRREPAPIRLSASIEAHWIEETGYSFPSGHAFTALFVATYFLAIAATYLTTRRIWLFYHCCRGPSCCAMRCTAQTS